MTVEELRAIAKQQNDDDYEAGRLPSRYVEDDLVLRQVARLILAGREPAPKESRKAS
jgi:hypothetical protein